MPRSLQAALLSSSIVLLGVFLFGPTSFAAVPTVQFNGNTYYKVDGNNPALDSGDEVCKSMGKKCVGYKSVNTNNICKLFHPTAKELISVNGSRAGFYCDGAPQQGLACAKVKNTCQVCPNCNMNEAEKCSNTIGQHFREMYVFCEAPTAGGSKSAGPAPIPGRNNRSSTRSQSSARSTEVTCTFQQKPLKRVSCALYKAGDRYCIRAMQSIWAKASICEETGRVVCSLPCSAQGANMFTQCAFGGVKSGSCSMSNPPAPYGPNLPGALCKHGGECTTGNCIGIGPPYGSEYRCSCDPFRYEVLSCKGASSSLASTNRPAGTLCNHGGQCQSGMCLGVVPGQVYKCSCIDPTTRIDNCRK